MRKEMIPLFTCIISLFISTLVFSQSKTLKGKVVDDAGLPVSGATIIIQGAKSGTVSGIDGSFEIQVTSGSRLVVTSSGNQPSVVSTDGKESLEITLQKNTRELSEVVVTALGIKREKRNLTLVPRK